MYDDIPVRQVRYLKCVMLMAAAWKQKESKREKPMRVTEIGGQRKKDIKSVIRENGERDSHRAKQLG